MAFLREAASAAVVAAALLRTLLVEARCGAVARCRWCRGGDVSVGLLHLCVVGNEREGSVKWESVES